MGAPAELTAGERELIAALAMNIVAAVESDEGEPLYTLLQRCYGAGRDVDWALLAMAQEILRLRGRVDELLAAIVRVSQVTPFSDEIEGWQAQRAKLIAEIGTLRAQLAERDTP